MNEYIEQMYETFLEMMKEYPISWVSEAYERAEEEYVLTEYKRDKEIRVYSTPSKTYILGREGGIKE